LNKDENITNILNSTFGNQAHRVLDQFGEHVHMVLDDLQQDDKMMH